MKTREETKEKTIIFFIIFIFLFVVIFSVIHKWIIRIPINKSVDISQNIEQCDRVFKTQKNQSEEILEIRKRIDTLDFNVHQVQRENEIKRDIDYLQNVYFDNNRHYEYHFGIVANRTLNFVYDMKVQLSTIKANRDSLIVNLGECKACLD